MQRLNPDVQGHYRNNQYVWIREVTDTAATIEQRIAVLHVHLVTSHSMKQLTHVPALHGEYLNCNHYLTGQHFHAHHDSHGNYEVSLQSLLGSMGSLILRSLMSSVL